jgi:hypothetical protein
VQLRKLAPPVDSDLMLRGRPTWFRPPRARSYSTMCRALIHSNLTVPRLVDRRWRRAVLTGFCGYPKVTGGMPFKSRLWVTTGRSVCPAAGDAGRVPSVRFRPLALAHRTHEGQNPQLTPRTRRRGAVSARPLPQQSRCPHGVHTRMCWTNEKLVKIGARIVRHGRYVVFSWSG